MRINYKGYEMIGSFLTRGLVMIFGYAYPAYECYKTVEKNKPEIEHLRFWCQYWILVALMTVFERVGDAFVSWLPMYSEAKLAVIIYLWYPKTKGTTYVYGSFFKPYVAKHETEIDRNLLELRTRAGDMAFMYCQKVASYGQTRIFEILQFVAAQSTPRPRPAQPSQPAPRARQPPVAARQPPRSQATPPQPQPQAQPQPQPQPQPQQENDEPPSPTCSTSSSQQDKEAEEELIPKLGPSASGTAPSPSPLKKSISLPVTPPAPRSSSQSTTNDAEAMQIEPVPARAEKPIKKPSLFAQEAVMEEAIRVTRGRLRKTRSTVTK